MNLKEAFRYQNRLKEWMQSINAILLDDSNVMKVEKTSYRSKVMPEAEDEKIVDEARSVDFAGRITELVNFQCILLEEREKLYAAISKAKAGLDIDMDSEISLNEVRRHMAKQYRYMSDKRASETMLSNAGIGYRFNAEGNQVSYRCDMKVVTTINFDRKVVRKQSVELQKKADEVSSKIDGCMINTQVEYTPRFDVNDSLLEIFNTYCETQKTA